MNRTVVIGGVVAVAVLLGVAAWLLIGGKTPKSTSEQLAAENAGPIALNPVAIVTDHAAAEAPDGRTLNITFPSFELSAKKGDTASAVFSTTWRMKVAPEERILVAVASINGYMKSTGASAPAAEPAVAAAPATPPAEGSTTPADGATPPAEAAAPPAESAPAAAPAPAKPAAGDGVARVIVTFGTDASVTEWTDANGTGGDRKVSKATTFLGGPDMRDGATVPVTVTVELNGGTSADSIARISSLDLRLFAESAPVTPPTTATEPSTTGETTTPPAADATTPPAETPPAGTTTTPPADGATQPAPDSGTTPPPPTGTTP